MYTASSEHPQPLCPLFSPGTPGGEKIKCPVSPRAPRHTYLIA